MPVPLRNISSKYIQAYEKLGTHIDAITTQNEPLHSQAGYSMMYMSDESARLVQNYVGPALVQAGLNTDIWAYDHNTDVKDAILPSEHHQRAWPNAGPPHPHHGNQAADFTMGPLQNWASGVMAWTLGTNDQHGPHLSSGGCANCRGLMTIANGGYTFNLADYMMAQFSKSMPPGAIVLSGTGSYTYSNGGVQSVASLNPDGTRPVVVENTFSNNIYITLSTKSGQEWSGDFPSQSVTTWVLPAA
ncbi:unnamed protein product [Penicillium nalgiovense]|nr:unnamed protein product [Penicillium nalgiovense]CAG8189045.1 unnamed protein product [Penicillium nalgiovense]CAG8194103.1 unnamed protein product [Penicillium nalgiovense]CAG8195482.1 unnamed protein product [Penicillium nalgiovense]CAG8205417.1 unnamed protein product [Penicillium nalgiovense]